MGYDVKVSISLTKAIGKAGFGIPLILVENATTPVPYTEASSLGAIVTAGFASTTDAYKAASLIFEQENAPEKVAVAGVTGAATTFLSDQTNVAKGWRQLIVINGDDEETATTVDDISTAVKSLQGKLYFAGLDTDDTTALTTTGNKRTVAFYCDATVSVPVPVAALVGETAGREVGSFTYKNLVLSGIEPQELSDTEIEAIHTKGGITFVQKAGDNVTSEGKVLSGEYIDIIDSQDYIIQQLTYRTQRLLNNAAKVPFDNNGIAMLESAAVDVLQGAYNSGMIATKADGNPDYDVNYALNDSVEASDRAIRKYIGGTFRFRLAGAVHEVEITGTIDI